jgi:hypothetical protein
MRILAIERPVDGAGPAQFTPELAAAEAHRAWDLHQAGVIRELFFRRIRPRRCSCSNVRTSPRQRPLASLPIVAGGLIEFEVLPLRAYSDFARLFRTIPD